jgi:glycosyltransferase involved in cell wall biosynthesis
MKSAILHIGAPKTGSTFLQRWLEFNHPLLAASGCFALPLMSSHRLAVACIRNAERLERRDARRLSSEPLAPVNRQLREAVADPAVDRVVISSEYFTDADPSATAACLAEHGLALQKIVCFVRRQDRMVASSFNQSVKVQGNAATPSLTQYRASHDWLRLYDAWHAACPNADIAMRNYDLHARNRTLLETFRTEINIEPDEAVEVIPPIERSNPGLNADLLEICRLANERGHTHLGNFLLRAQIDGFDGPAFGLAQKQVDALEQVYADNNRTLAEKTGAQELTELARAGWTAEGTTRIGRMTVDKLLDLLAFLADRDQASEIAGPQAHTGHRPDPQEHAARPDPFARIARVAGSAARHLAAWVIRPVFDTRYYLAAYPDVARGGAGPVRHYLNHGRREGRLRKPMPFTCCGNAALFNPDRKTVLLVMHEGSRTGAPIIAYNLVLGLRQTYNVVVLSMGPGPVAEACAAQGAYVAVAGHRIDCEAAARPVLRRLTRRFTFAFAILNAFGSRFALPHLRAHGIPVIALIHEFAANIQPRRDLVSIAEQAHAMVFPSEIVRQNALTLLPALYGRHMPVIPQGRCSLPPAPRAMEPDHAVSDLAIREALGLAGDPAAPAVIILGAGFVDYRKGTDLFLQCAANMARRYPDLAAHFVWVGNKPEAETGNLYAAYLEDQARRDALDHQVHFTGEVIDMDVVYRQADIFALTSRLDPLPNVCIEAMAAGLPLVCFDNASGFPDMLSRLNLEPDCVARYLDVDDMTDKLAALVTDPARRMAVGARLSQAADRTFSMPDYVHRIEELARQAVAASEKRHP